MTEVQMRIGFSPRTLRLNVDKDDGCVTCLNYGEFTELDSHWLSSGIKRRGTLLSDEECEKKVQEIVEKFKEYYNCDKVEIVHLSREEVSKILFPEVK